MITELAVLFVFIIILLVAAFFTWASLNTAMKRREKFKVRVTEAVSQVARPANYVEEQITLARTVSPTEVFLRRAAGIIGVDLDQAETYPIKWWLVPGISFLITWFLIFLAVHPLHNYTLSLYLFGFPIGWLITTKFVFSWLNNRRNALLLEQFPDALNTIVRCVRVGIPIGEALRTVAVDSPEPTAAEFRIMADKVQIGIPLDIMLGELSQRVKMTEYQFFATALTLQSRSGGGITQTLETLADVIRKRVGLKQRGYALTSEARTSAMILALLPFFAGGAIFVMQRPYISLLFYTQGGQDCLGAAVLMLLVGLGIIQFMISSVLK